MSRVSQARSLGKYFLLVDNMLVVLGFFVVFPLISIRFVDQMGWAALMVGIAPRSTSAGATRFRHLRWGRLPIVSAPNR
ncbi:MFS superfamily export protein YceL [Klebsiella aerogenes]|nr:MFS superfamily export protein YceL [Klebsiella aerogenes]